MPLEVACRWSVLGLVGLGAEGVGWLDLAFSRRGAAPVLVPDGMFGLRGRVAVVIRHTGWSFGV